MNLTISFTNESFPISFFPFFVCVFLFYLTNWTTLMQSQWALFCRWQTYIFHAERIFRLSVSLTINRLPIIVRSIFVDVIVRSIEQYVEFTCQTKWKCTIQEKLHKIFIIRESEPDDYEVQGFVPFQLLLVSPWIHKMCASLCVCVCFLFSRFTYELRLPAIRFREINWIVFHVLVCTMPLNKATNHNHAHTSYEYTT